MRNLIVALAAALTFPLPAAAGSSLSIDRMDCSGDLVTSIFDDISISCSGSFSISGGSITSSSSVEILANGDLSLDNLTISAPLIWLGTVGTVSLGDGIAIYLGNRGNGGEISSMPIPNRDATIVVSGYSVTGPVRDVGVLQSEYPGSIVVLPGADITLTAAVPEPEIVGSLLAGLPIVFCVARRRVRRVVQTTAHA